MPRFQGAANLGNYSGAWLKNPLIFGISGLVAEQFSNTQAVTAGDKVTLATVPDNQIWVVTSFGYKCGGIFYQKIALVETRDSVDYVHLIMDVTTTSQVAGVACNAILAPSSVISAMFGQSRASESHVISISGYAMNIAEVG